MYSRDGGMNWALLLSHCNCPTCNGEWLIFCKTKSVAIQLHTKTANTALYYRIPPRPGMIWYLNLHKTKNRIPVKVGHKKLMIIGLIGCDSLCVCCCACSSGSISECLMLATYRTEFYMHAYSLNTSYTTYVTGNQYKN